mgnify:CR=1 FL=1
MLSNCSLSVRFVTIFVRTAIAKERERERVGIDRAL